MAINHARICQACERECPEWADRCPACGSLSLLRQFVIVPSAPAYSTRAKPPRSPSSRRRRSAGRESPRPHGAPAHSTA